MYIVYIGYGVDFLIVCVFWYIECVGFYVIVCVVFECDCVRGWIVIDIVIICGYVEVIEEC